MGLRYPACLVLEDGTHFQGTAFGHFHETSFAVGEVVFNTAITGYQEILTDPSYASQLITLTFPQIGNVGINAEDAESSKIFAKGLIIRQLSPIYSNWRAQLSLSEYLAKQGVLGISDIDTRQLTRLIREKGALRGCIVSAKEMTKPLLEEALQRARGCPSLQGKDLAKEVSSSIAYPWVEGGMDLKRYHVVAYDFGIKKSILRSLHEVGCKITVVPAQTSAKEVLSLNPDGIFLSNGPGDPEPCSYAILAIQTFLQHNVPLFGICLGHQLLALACGAKTVKMKIGHHGGNHPVRCLKTNRVLITSQNHGFTVDEPLPSYLAVTHRSLFDNTIQGISHQKRFAFGFQGHPEAGPGPTEARELFSHFAHLMQQYIEQKQTLLEPL